MKTRTTTWPLGKLIEEFPITFASGRVLVGSLYGSTSRQSGRRIVVREKTGGTVLFDTDECHDASNAVARLDAWLVCQESTTTNTQED